MLPLPSVSNKTTPNQFITQNDPIKKFEVALAQRLRPGSLTAEPLRAQLATASIYFKARGEVRTPASISEFEAILELAELAYRTQVPSLVEQCDRALTEAMQGRLFSVMRKVHWKRGMQLALWLTNRPIATNPELLIKILALPLPQLQSQMIPVFTGAAKKILKLNLNIVEDKGTPLTQHIEQLTRPELQSQAQELMIAKADFLSTLQRAVQTQDQALLDACHRHFNLHSGATLLTLADGTHQLEFTKECSPDAVYSEALPLLCSSTVSLHIKAITQPLCEMLTGIADRINHCDLSNYQLINDSVLGALVRTLPQLPSLKITSFPRVTQIGWQQLSYLAQLQTLACEFKSANDSINQLTLNLCPNLNSIQVRFASNSLPRAVVPFLKNLPRQTAVNVWFCTDSNHTAEVAKAVPQALSWRQSNFTDSDLMAIGSYCPLLQELAINNTKALTAKGFQAIATGCPKLRSLTLMSTAGFHAHSNPERIEDRIDVLIKKCRGLQSVGLYGYDILPNSLLKTLTKLPNWRHITLSSGSVSEGYVDRLRKKLPAHKVLHVTNCQTVTPWLSTALYQDHPAIPEATQQALNQSILRNVKQLQTLTPKHSDAAMDLSWSLVRVVGPIIISCMPELQFLTLRKLFAKESKVALSSLRAFAQLIPARTTDEKEWMLQPLQHLMKSLLTDVEKISGFPRSLVEGAFDGLLGSMALMMAPKDPARTERVAQLCGGLFLFLRTHTDLRPLLASLRASFERHTNSGSCPQLKMRHIQAFSTEFGSEIRAIWESEREDREALLRHLSQPLDNAVYEPLIKISKNPRWKALAFKFQERKSQVFEKKLTEEEEDLLLIGTLLGTQAASSVVVEEEKKHTVPSSKAISLQFFPSIPAASQKRFLDVLGNEENVSKKLALLFTHRHEFYFQNAIDEQAMLAELRAKLNLNRQRSKIAQASLDSLLTFGRKVGRFLGMSRCTSRLYSENQKLEVLTKTLAVARTTIAQLSQSKPLTEKRQDPLSQAFRQVRAIAAQDPNKALEKLRAQKLVTVSQQQRMERYRVPRALIAKIGSVALLQKLIGRDYVIATHGQGLPWLAPTHLIKELMRLFNSPATALKDLSHFKFLRFPDSSLKGLLRSKIAWGRNDLKYARDLLSVDCFPWSYSVCDASAFFATVDSNVNTETLPIVKSIIKQFIKNADAVTLLANQIVNLAQEVRAQSQYGLYYAICVPKKILSRMGYLCHPFGYKCTCHPNTPDSEIIDKLQRGIFDASTQCDKAKGGAHGLAPQLRLLTREITPSNVKILRFTPVDKEARDALKAKVRSVAEEIYTIAKMENAS